MLRVVYKVVFANDGTLLTRLFFETRNEALGRLIWMGFFFFKSDALSTTTLSIELRSFETTINCNLFEFKIFVVIRVLFV